MRLVVAVASLIVMVTAAGAAAAPDRRFEVVDRGDQVEVIATGVTAKPGAKVAVVRERLEIELAGMPRPGVRESADTTVRTVEIRGSRRVLSMKLRFDHDGVVALRGRAAFVQSGDTLRVTIPRKLLAAPPPPVAATASAPAADARAPSATPPSVTPAVTAPVAAAPAANGAAPVVPPATVAPAAPAVAEVVTVEPPLPPLVTGTGAGTAPTITPLSTRPPTTLGSNRWLLVLVGLILVGGGVAATLLRKRKPPVAGADIDVIASRSLGGKSRIVWLAAGDREVLVAVSPQAVRLLGSWRRGERGERTDRTERGLGDLADLGDLGEIEELEPDLEPVLADRPSRRYAQSARRDEERPVPRDTERQVRPDTERLRTDVARGSSVRLQPSPAVSGILRLRGQSAAAKLPTEDASDDPEADEQWARDVLANTPTGPR